MFDDPFFQSEFFRWVLLPLLIFLSRIMDVSLGTVRLMLLNRNQRLLAPLLGFFEVLIWLLAMGQIMQNLSNVICYIAYPLGFSAGTIVGMKIEQKMALGVLLVRVITRKNASVLIRSLRNKGYYSTTIQAQGNKNIVNVIYCVIKRSDLNLAISMIKEHNPKAFYSVQDVREVDKGTVFPSRMINRRLWGRFLARRKKGK